MEKLDFNFCEKKLKSNFSRKIVCNLDKTHDNLSKIRNRNSELCFKLDKLNSIVGRAQLRCGLLNKMKFYEVALREKRNSSYVDILHNVNSYGLKFCMS